MSDTLREQFESVLARVRQPARLIGGEWGSGPGFTGDPRALRVVLAFPDRYDIGISNQALQILYFLARDFPGIEVERVYLPWVDVIKEMRRKGMPLLSLESWTPVKESDLVAVTLQHEFNYTNLLQMLHLADFPVSASARSDTDPLVLVGGPACANFWPVAGFVDAVAVGDGEELFPEVLKALAAAKQEGASRREKKRRLAEIEGVYVPGLSVSVRRRTISRLQGAPYPTQVLVPLTEGVHDRAWVEVMRGCTRGCRFCQAGVWYRPVRERSADEVMRLAEEQLRLSGHNELALGSLSTTDYSQLEDLLSEAACRFPEVRVSLPSLRVDTAAVRLAALASPTGPSLTLAPEAGSARMWSVINKNVNEQDVLLAAEEAFAQGRTTLKLYFMIGLPLETDEDVLAIAELCLRLRDVGRRVLGARASRLQLNISVNNFVPKPFTPFQWCGMADRATLARRQELLKKRLRGPGLRISCHDIERSFLEAALARGGEEMAVALERAWSEGAFFDQWTEQFHGAAWTRALASIGKNSEELATTFLSPEGVLPWEVIEGAADRGFLWQEWEKAKREETTADCRFSGCSACGACGDKLSNDLAIWSKPGASRSTAHPREACLGSAQTGAARSSGGCAGGGRRYLARFSVTGRGRFLGHLDRSEVFRRAVRRAGGRLALSQGLRPKPALVLALPLAVGVEGAEELCEFELAEEPPADFAVRLGEQLPAGMTLLSLVPRNEEERPLAREVRGASYELTLAVGEGEAQPGGEEGESGTRRWVEEESRLVQAGRDFAAAERLLVEDLREGEKRVVDVKRFVERVVVRSEKGEPGGEPRFVVAFRTSVSPEGSARPEHVVEAMRTLSGLPLAVIVARRVRIHLASEKACV